MDMSHLVVRLGKDELVLSVSSEGWDLFDPSSSLSGAFSSGMFGAAGILGAAGMVVGARLHGFEDVVLLPDEDAEDDAGICIDGVAGGVLGLYTLPISCRIFISHSSSVWAVVNR